MISPFLGLVLFGLLILALGISYQLKSVINWSIKLSNQMRGVKTHITRTTIITNKIVGIILIILGLFIILTALFKLL